MTFPFKAIVSRTSTYEEFTSKPGAREFRWRSVEVTTVVLECGHSKVYRASSGPKNKVRCKECPPVLDLKTLEPYDTGGYVC